MANALGGWRVKSIARYLRFLHAALSSARRKFPGCARESRASQSKQSARSNRNTEFPRLRLKAPASDEYPVKPAITVARKLPRYWLVWIALERLSVYKRIDGA
ncbi:MAG TPA: hypothetical protein DEP05_06055, partial [Betaproteobacteria bacterium]|nr:hypothetical protein [Betaproteobacteria bacterium]